MKKLITILFAAFSFCISASAQTNNSTANAGGPEFNFINGRVYDFGRRVINTKATYKFEFKNTGDQPLVITEMHSEKNEITSPPYKLLINWPKEPIKPGKKGVISVTVVTQDDIGSFQNEIYVTSNATRDNFPLLLVGGAVVPEKSQPDVEYKPLTAAGAALGAFMVNNIKK
jgi:hypothetical protein